MNATTHDLIAHRLSATPGLIADRTASVDLAALGWERMRVILEHLGNPQQAVRAIHIAGSKGKGTTAHLSEALLRVCGLKTGLFTSPHIDQWNERIALAGLPIADAPFLAVLQEAEAAIRMAETSRPELGTGNAFELITAAAMLAFRMAGVDLTVIETGLGGRFDSTNHLRPTATVLTRIEREHVEILGPTLSDIVWNKTGILKAGVPVVVQQQQPEVAVEIEAAATAIGAPAFWQDIDWSVTQVEKAARYQGPGGVLDLETVPLPGAHNRSNLGAAICACQLAVPELGLTSALASTGVGRIAIPGRFETITLGGQTLILDVAHTRESAANVIRTAAEHFGVARFPVLLAMLTDKPAGEILEAMRPWLGRLILPVVRHPRTMAPQVIQAAASELGIVAETVSDVRQGMALLADEPICIATGSFAIVHDMRDLARGTRIWR